MSSILDQILASKQGELERARQLVDDAAMAERADAMSGRPRGFRRALAQAPPPAVIAEIKRRSPSRGLIRPDFDPVAIARAYAAGGAAALSVLTDEAWFGGELGYLGAVRAAVELPLLRKDFVVDAYQIDEARVAGADAVLLIAAALPAERLLALHAHARSRELDVLVEVHDESELELALEARADLIGVNNRDLRSFEVDLAVTERIAERLKRAGRLAEGGVLLVAESGIAGPADIARLQGGGAAAFLVGESLMRRADVRQALVDLRRTP